MPQGPKKLTEKEMKESVKHQQMHKREMNKRIVKAFETYRGTTVQHGYHVSRYQVVAFFQAIGLKKCQHLISGAIAIFPDTTLYLELCLTTL